MPSSVQISCYATADWACEALAKVVSDSDGKTHFKWNAPFSLLSKLLPWHLYFLHFAWQKNNWIYLGFDILHVWLIMPACCLKVFFPPRKWLHNGFSNCKHTTSLPACGKMTICIHRHIGQWPVIGSIFELKNGLIRPHHQLRSSLI